MTVVPESDEIVAGVRAGERAMISRAVTMLESRRPEHRLQARRLLEELGPGPAGTVRIGISGTSGVGKSTFIEAFGLRLVDRGHRVGVLAAEPSGTGADGAAQSDRPRMPGLAGRAGALVRPSPSADTPGGITRSTAQTIPLLEAAGCDVVLVETAGTGRSETAVAGMVDTFLLLGLAPGGEQLRGITKGVLEMADLIVMNKADSGFEREARTAAKELAGALRLVYRGSRWVPPVLTASALQRTGLDDVWEAVQRHRTVTGEATLAHRRAQQQWSLAQTMVREELEDRLRRSRGVRSVTERVRADVLDGRSNAVAAADTLLSALDRD